jgi:aminoacrylate peracid reductase
MPKVTINPPGAPPPLAPYSSGTRAGDTVYVSGILALDKDGVVGVGDVRAQTRCVLDNIKAVVETAGGSMADIAFNSIFLKDLKDYGVFNEIYREYFPLEPPARYCIRADLVREEFLVEISSIAYLGS